MTKRVAHVERLRRVHFNSIWLVPLIAILVASWMLYQNWASQGPVITLIASNAEGLEAGQTKLKARNVDVGKVIDIRLSEDYEKAIVQVRMNQGTQKMLREGTQFWVVKPRIGREGVSGLGTLLSGAYIDMAPSLEGQETRQFTLLNQPPLLTKNEGLRVFLHSENGAKLSVGTVVHFRGYDVGYVEEVGFDTESGNIIYRVVVKPPYDALLNERTQFWVTPGLSFRSSVQGFEVKLDSLETFLLGGISFGLGESRSRGKPISDLTSFRLFASKDDADNHVFSNTIEYVFLFDANVSGLAAGADVEFRGVRVGTVLEVPFTGIPVEEIAPSASHQRPVIPVLARIEPQRLDSSVVSEQEAIDHWQENLPTYINQGLRARLEIGNYLNAARVISLDFIDNPPSHSLKTVAGYQVFPTSATTFAGIENQISQVLDTLVQVPLKETFEQLNQTIGSADETLRQLQLMSEAVKQLLDQSDTQALPEKLSDAIIELNRTLATYQASGQIGRPVRENMVLLNRTLNELQPLLRQLRENPNTLIFDSKPQTDVQPRAAQ